jgi:hypothetical protein
LLDERGEPVVEYAARAPQPPHLTRTALLRYRHESTGVITRDKTEAKATIREIGANLLNAAVPPAMSAWGLSSILEEALRDTHTEMKRAIKGNARWAIAEIEEKMCESLGSEQIHDLGEVAHSLCLILPAHLMPA